MIKKHKFMVATIIIMVIVFIILVLKEQKSNTQNLPMSFDWTRVGLIVDTNTEYICKEGPVLNFTSDGKVILLVDGMVIATVDAKNLDNIEQAKKLLSFSMEIDGNLLNATIMMANENDIKIILDGNDEYICKKTILTNGSIYSNAEILEVLGRTNYKGSYRGTWRVIKRENGIATLISSTPVTSYTLGNEDLNAKGTSDIEKAIWSYKNAINTLNMMSKEATENSSARCIEIKDIFDCIGEIEYKNQVIKNENVYKYYYDSEKQKVFSKSKRENGIWSQPIDTGYFRQIFIDNDGEIKVVDSKGDEVTLVSNSMTYILTDNQKAKIKEIFGVNFWLASGDVDGSIHSTRFEMKYISYDGHINNELIFRSDGYSRNETYGVLALITVSGL